MKHSSRQKPKSNKGKLVALFAFFFLLFNFPILGLIDDQLRIKGIPAIYIYFLITWAVLIITIWKMVNHNTKPS